MVLNFFTTIWNCIVILTTIITIILSVIFYKYRKIALSLQHFPGPKLTHFLGNSLEITGSKDVLPKLESFRNSYGRVFRMIMGNQGHIFITDQKIVQTLLSSTKHINKGDFYMFAKRWLKEGLVTSNGKKWRQRRKLLTSAFHFQILEKFVNVFDRQSSILVEKLQDDVGKNSVDIWDKVHRWALDVISETAMGISIDAQNDHNNKYTKALHGILHIIIENVFSFMANIPPLHYLTKNYWKERRLLKIVHRESRSIIELKRKELQSKSPQNEYNGDNGSKKKMALLDLLLEAEIDGRPLTDDDIQEEVDTFLFTGHDTTTITTCFALYSIANNPRIQKVLLDEITTIVGADPSSKITMQNISNMKYLDMTIKETLRRYTVTPLISRKLDEDLEIDDYKFPKGSNIFIFIYGMHMDSKYFPEPEIFKPERFLLEEKGNFSFIPFSAGPRNCIGQRFAMLEVKLTLCKILRNFELLPAIPHHEVQLHVESVLKSSNGVRIRLKRRCP